MAHVLLLWSNIVPPALVKGRWRMFWDVGHVAGLVVKKTKVSQPVTCYSIALPSLYTHTGEWFSGL